MNSHVMALGCALLLWSLSLNARASSQSTLAQRLRLLPLERQRAVLEAALQLRDNAAGLRTMHSRESAVATVTACSNHSVIVDIEGLTGRSEELSHPDALDAMAESSSLSLEAEANAPSTGSGWTSMLQTASFENDALRQAAMANIITKPFANCKCEEYACTCSKGCGCKLTGDGGSKLVKKLNPRMAPGELIGQGASRGQKPSIPDYNFRCMCNFDVEQSVMSQGGSGSGGGEERSGLATADGSMRCGCGEGQCECRRVCRCDTQASSFLQEGISASSSHSGTTSRRRDTTQRQQRGASRTTQQRLQAVHQQHEHQHQQEQEVEKPSPSPKPVDAGWDSGSGPGAARGKPLPKLNVDQQIVGQTERTSGAKNDGIRVPRFVEDAATKAIHAAHAGSNVKLHLPA